MMMYDSEITVESQLARGVTFTVAKMSFGRRTKLMRQVRELAKQVEFLKAGRDVEQQMDSALLRVEIDRLYVKWGLTAITGLHLDGAPATPDLLIESGPEELFREAVAVVRAQTGLSTAERKN
jgi:hypothetical protein